MDAQGFDIKPHEELIYEIRRGHRQIYKALIDSGANINYQNNINETPLTVALYRNDFDAIKELVNAGADINFKNRYGSTILTTAASLGKIEAVTLLIKLGADINIKNIDGNTALDIAISNRNTELIKAMENAIIDKNRVDKITTDKSNNPKSMGVDAEIFMNEVLADKRFTKEITQYQEDLHRITGANSEYQDYSALVNAVKEAELTSPLSTVSDLIQGTESSKHHSQSTTKGKELVQFKPGERFTKEVSAADNAALAQVITKLARSIKSSPTSRAISRVTPKAPRIR